MKKEVCERTLVDKEIINWAKSENWMEEGGIYENFEEKCVRGETYDIRAGNLIIVGEPDGKRKYISLKDQKEIAIEPFKAATLQSLERIKLPLTMYGELWIRNELQHRGLAFTGGDVDPGFWGYLYIKIHNVGPAPVSIRFEEEIASIRFSEMCEAASEPYTETEILKPRDQQLPPTPPRILYDWLQLSTKLDQLKSALDNIKWVHDRFIVGLITGLVGGIVLAAILAIFKAIGIILFP
jgi:deoxycytidine triphosphate deaminase